MSGGAYVTELARGNKIPPDLAKETPDNAHCAAKHGKLRYGLSFARAKDQGFGQTGEKRGHTLTSLRILLVDDDLDTLNVLRRLLAREGHEVLTGKTVAGGIELARKGPVDLLISDIALPDGSGYELMAAVKSMHGAPGIALSGYVEERDKQRAVDAGFCLHLDKPVRFDDVLQAIEDCHEGDTVVAL